MADPLTRETWETTWRVRTWFREEQALVTAFIEELLKSNEAFRYQLRQHAVGPMPPDYTMWHCRACNCSWPAGDPRERHYQTCLAQPSKGEIEIGLRALRAEGKSLPP